MYFLLTGNSSSLMLTHSRVRVVICSIFTRMDRWVLINCPLKYFLFSQILGLVDVFDYLAYKDANVASTILAKGIKLTFYPTLYGLIIYLVSILVTAGLKFQLHRTEV